MAKIECDQSHFMNEMAQHSVILRGYDEVLSEKANKVALIQLTLGQDQIIESKIA